MQNPHICHCNMKQPEELSPGSPCYFCGRKIPEKENIPAPVNSVAPVLSNEFIPPDEPSDSGYIVYDYDHDNGD